MRECKTTLADVDGYPEYRRRMTGPYANTIPELGKHRDIHNGWVVPYNPYLLVKFDTHINVEISTSIKGIKYIFKYIYKGGEKVEIKIRVVDGGETYLDLDEIKTWANARYISANEAIWRIFEFPTNSLSHKVERLSIHLPDEQCVVFTEQNAETVGTEPELSTLTAYFALCGGDGYDQEDRDLGRVTKYHDIPQYFTYNKSKKRWNRRPHKAPESAVMYWNSNKPIIGRMYDVSPKNLELYALRLLLLHRVGAESFDDLKFIPDHDQNGNTIPIDTYIPVPGGFARGVPERLPQGHICHSFHMAAKELGLMLDDREWHSCLHEASQWAMPFHMCKLFALILMNCEVNDPQNLWDDTCHLLIMSDWQIRRHNLCPNNLLLNAYLLIEKEIKRCNSNTTLEETYHIQRPIAPHNPFTHNTHAGDDASQNPAPNQAHADEMISQLNPDQLTAFQAIYHSISNNEGKCFFLDGPGGTGKSYLYRCLMTKIRADGETYSACASTAIAATVIDACTAHKLFYSPCDLEHDSCSALHANTYDANLLKTSRCIIWDEAPSSHRYLLELTNRLLKDICQNDLPFGGKTMLLGGDWRQTLPVVPRANNAQQIAACLRMSPLWPLFAQNTYLLTINMRSKNPEFSQWLLDIGNGIVGDDINLAVPDLRVVSSSHGLITATFGHCLDRSTLPSLARCAILSPTNANAAKLNEVILAMIPEASSFRYSVDFPITEREKNPLVIPTEFLNTLDPPGMPPHKLHLKLGAIYMLLRNLNVTDGLCNGTRFFLDAFDTNVLFCIMIQDDPNKPEKKFTLPRITLSPPMHYPFPFKRRQFPIKPAFVMTINKAQGGTLDVIGLEATTPVFAHGQAYVALSRVSDFKKITVLTPAGLPSTRNVVFQEVFDQDYIDTQIRLRSQRPVFGERMHTDHHHMPADNSNPYYNDEEEAFMDHLDQPEPCSVPQYDHDDDHDHHYPDAHQYTYDEMVFEDDQVPHDWQE
jgi:hypothetical protein